MAFRAAERDGARSLQRLAWRHRFCLSKPISIRWGRHSCLPKGASFSPRVSLLAGKQRRSMVTVGRAANVVRNANQQQCDERADHRARGNAADVLEPINPLRRSRWHKALDDLRGAAVGRQQQHDAPSRQGPARSSMKAANTEKLSRWAQGISVCRSHGSSPETPMTRAGFGDSKSRLRNTTYARQASLIMRCTLVLVLKVDAASRRIMQPFGRQRARSGETPLLRCRLFRLQGTRQIPPPPANDAARALIVPPGGRQ